MSGVGRTFTGFGKGTFKNVDANLYISGAFLASFVYANNVRLIFWSGKKDNLSPDFLLGKEASPPRNRWLNSTDSQRQRWKSDNISYVDTYIVFQKSSPFLSSQQLSTYALTRRVHGVKVKGLHAGVFVSIWNATILQHFWDSWRSKSEILSDHFQSWWRLNLLRSVGAKSLWTWRDIRPLLSGSGAASLHSGRPYAQPAIGDAFTTGHGPAVSETGVRMAPMVNHLRYHYQSLNCPCVAYAIIEQRASCIFFTRKPWFQSTEMSNEIA